MLFRSNSLSFRLIAGAAALSAVLLTAGGFALSEIFRSAVQEGFDDQLTFDLDGLIAAAESDAPGHVTFENRFADPRFERIFSGWYWQIVPDTEPGAEPPPQVSRSLWDQTVAPKDLMRGDNNAQWGYASGPEDRKSTRLNSSHT